MSNAANNDDFEVDFDIDDTDPHNLFTSPDKKHQKKVSSGANGTPLEHSEDSRGRLKESESREAALQQELDNVRKINEVLESVHSSLEKAKNNMEVREHVGLH
jgi:hypothetical protein